MINFHKDIIIRHYYKVTGVPIAMYFFRIHVTLFFVITPLSISPHGGNAFLYFLLCKTAFCTFPLGEGQDGGFNIRKLYSKFIYTACYLNCEVLHSYRDATGGRRADSR